MPGHDANIFHDVTTGGNYGYQAGKGWDPVTGARLGRWNSDAQRHEAEPNYQGARFTRSGDHKGQESQVDEQQTEQKVGSPE